MQRNFSLSRTMLSLLFVLGTFPGLASDHADAPSNADDRGTDLGDAYMFLDPNDNTRVIAIMTISGFIVPGENANFGIFSEDGLARFTFDFENTGDAVSDRSIRVTFGPKTSPAAPQTATIELWDGRTFTAPTTIGSATAETAPAPTITTDGPTGIMFYAGVNDDPFFFDIPAFGRFVASVRAGTPNPALFSRGRDSFAGYNILSIAFSIPAALLKGSAGDVIGISQQAQRHVINIFTPGGGTTGSGRYVNRDRQGLPGINVVLIPFPRKKEYNSSRPQDDAAGRFANDIVATLQSLGTNSTNIGILAGLAVSRGDILRLDTSRPNTGTGGGNNPGGGFPNGRRLSDDVIDTVLFFVANQNTLGDSVNGNDVPFRDTFPFLAPAHQPLPTGAVDLTRN